MENIPFKNLGAGSHWERPKIATGEVIALPAAAAGDIAPQDNYENNQTKQLSYN